MPDFINPGQDLNEMVQVEVIRITEVEKNGKKYFRYRTISYHAKNNHMYIKDTCPHILVADYDPLTNKLVKISEKRNALPAMHNWMHFISPDFVYTKQYHK